MVKIQVNSQGKAYSTSDGKVLVSNGIIPEGTVSITENGTHDVTNYANADVNVVHSKFGATIDNIFGDVNENGELKPVTGEQFDLVFNGVKTITHESAPSFIGTFARSQRLRSVTFPDLEINYNATLGATDVTNDVVGFWKTFYASTIKSISIPKLEYIGYSSTMNLDTNVTNLDNAFLYTFESCQRLETIDLPKLKEIVYGSNLFNACFAVKELSFPELHYICNCNYAFSQMLMCTNFNFPKLSVIRGSTNTGNSYLFSSLGSSIANTNDYLDITFPKLQIVTGNIALRYGFNGAHVKSISFPALIPDFNKYYIRSNWNGSYTTIYTNVFQSMLSGVRNCTVHFPSNLESVIGDWSDVLSGFGGTNTTILFDLDPTTAENDYIVDENGKLIRLYVTTDPVSFIGVKSLENGILDRGCTKTNLGTTAEITFPDLEKIDYQQACHYAFAYNQNLTTFNAPKLTQAHGYRALYAMFYKCPNLTTVNIDNLSDVIGDNACGYMFAGCTNLTNINTKFIIWDESVSTSTRTNGKYEYLFQDCTSLTNIAFTHLTKITGRIMFNYCFQRCTSLQTVTYSALTEFGEDNMSYFTNTSNRSIFDGCSALKDIYFPALTTASLAGRDYIFSLMLTRTGSTGTTVHFPSNLQSIVSQMSGYPSWDGTNATTVFDLPATE